MADTVRIQVLINEKVMGQDFQDAIYYPDLATYQAKVADGSHEAQKQQRLLNQENVIKNPAPPPVFTKAQLESMKAELLAKTDAEVADLNAQIAEKGK